MQPVPVRVLPSESALPGGTQYSIKLDGVRAIAAVDVDHRVRMVSRRGTDLTGRFPQLLPALSDLAVGTVLDGEIVAVDPQTGRLDFTALLRTSQARAAAGVQVLYVAFDLLAVPGVTITGRPLRERWAMLEVVLAGARPPLQLCMATESRAEAQAWFEQLEPLGIEGICAKGLSTTYRAGRSGRAWVKVRHSQTVDGRLVAVVGTPRRPEALVVELEGGRREVTSPRLTTAEARLLAELLQDRLVPARGESARTWAVVPPAPLVEVLVESGRHGGVRFVRLRADE